MYTTIPQNTWCYIKFKYNIDSAKLVSDLAYNWTMRLSHVQSIGIPAKATTNPAYNATG